MAARATVAILVAVASAANVPCVGFPAQPTNEDIENRQDGCNVILGDLHLGNFLGTASELSGNVEDLAFITEIRGSLTCKDNDNLGGVQKLVEITNLKKIGGSLDILGNVKMEKWIFPALESVDGDVLFEDNRNSQGTILSDILMPKLSYVGDNLRIQNNKRLVNVNLDSLKDVKTGSLQFYNNVQLENIACPKLETVGANLQFNYLDVVKRIQLPVLKTIKDNFDIGDCPMLTEVDLLLLESMDTLRNLPTDKNLKIHINTCILTKAPEFEDIIRNLNSNVVQVTCSPTFKYTKSPSGAPTHAVYDPNNPNPGPGEGEYPGDATQATKKPTPAPGTPSGFGSSSGSALGTSSALLCICLLPSLLWA